MKIAIVGTGAIGGYYGCLLARAGQDVHFLLRSDYEVVKKQGFTIRQGDQEFTVPHPQIYQDPAGIGPVDLVVIALKSTANHHLPTLLKPLVGPQTLVLSLQNGLGNLESLAEFIPAVQLLGGLCFVCLNRVAPGVIENYLPGRLYLGEFMGRSRERTMRLVEHFEAAGVQAFFALSLEEALWRKLCWNIPFNGLTIAAGGIPTDQVLASEPLTTLAKQLMREVQTTAAAHGHQISDEFLESQLTVTREMGAYRPSSLVDFLAGNPVEVEAIFGEPLRRARKKRLKTPRLETLYLILRGLCDPLLSAEETASQTHL